MRALTRDEARARVAKGAAHLDQLRPLWFKDIDTGTLALETCHHCIIGQLGAHDISQQFSAALGFDLYEDEMDGDDRERPIMFRPLQDAWIDAIADRVLAAAQAHKQPTSVAALREDVDQPVVTPRA